MSHFTTIETQIRDIEALKGACMELGLVLDDAGEARGYDGRTQAGEYVIRLKGPYDIAVNRQESGLFQLATDWYQGHVEKEVGQDFRRLIQLYGVHKTMIEARKKGCTVSRTKIGNDAVKIRITGGHIS